MFLSESDVREVLSRKLQSDNFEVLAIEDRDPDDISIGYFSSFGKVSIQYKVNSELCNLNLFIKRLPIQQVQQEHLKIFGAFKKEADTYGFLDKIQQDDLLFAFPKCFLAKDGLIVLEDISIKGYRTVPLLTPFDLHHTLAVMDSLSVIHGYSLAFEQKENVKLPEKIPDLPREVIFTYDKNYAGRKRYDVGTKALKEVARIYLPQYDKEVVKMALDLISQVPYKLDPSSKFPNVLSHSDLWGNNIMFHYSNGEVDQACIIDFQCATYRPPAFDVLVYLFCCTEQTLRAEHLPLILDHYYNSLKQELLKHKISIEDLLDKETFDEMIRDYLPVTLALAPQFMHFVGIPENIIRPIMSDSSLWKEYYENGRTDVVLRGMKQSNAYRKKITEGLSDLFDYCKNILKEK